MKIIEYCIEYKLEGESFYRKFFYGLKDKAMTIEFAQNAIRDKIIGVRVVEQTRKVIKVFH